MQSRRDFLKSVAVAAAASRSVLGANDKVQMGLIGTGGRGMQVWAGFSQHSDIVFVAACDVNSARLEPAVQKIGGKVETYKDYKRLLENKNVDAVLIATPDHWHSQIMIDALSAGKDVYVEKPVSNTLAAAQKMLQAYQKSKQIVQVGTQQRSWPHFQECCKMVQDGYIGTVNHAVCLYPGGYARVMQPTEAPPATLDWDMWQGPAPRRPYSPSRMMWRAFYAYGGGLITDWGVHLTDIAHLALNTSKTGPLMTSGSGQYVSIPRDPEQVPDTFNCSWEYEKFVMTFTNMQPPASQETTLPSSGNWFYGTKGILLVNRSGYKIWPAARRGFGGGGARGGARQGAPGAPGAPAAGAPAGVPAFTPPPQEPPAEAKEFLAKSGGGMGADEGTVLHTRNFLDCVKSRNKPNAEFEIGFTSTLPTLLALMAIQQHRSLSWDGKESHLA